MYAANIEGEDYSAIEEDIIKVVINHILQGDVIKVLVCLVRIDCFD